MTFSVAAIVLCSIWVWSFKYVYPFYFLREENQASTSCGEGKKRKKKKGLGQQTGLVSLCIELKNLGCERMNAFHLGKRMMSARVQFAMGFELFVWSHHWRRKVYSPIRIILWFITTVVFCVSLLSARPPPTLPPQIKTSHPVVGFIWYCCRWTYPE